LFGSVLRVSQEVPQRVLPGGQTETVTVAVTVVVVVVTGVGAVVVRAVMPQHEQALLYAEGLGQSEA
jgi:hypothetical protein